MIFFVLNERNFYKINSALSIPGVQLFKYAPPNIVKIIRRNVKINYNPYAYIGLPNIVEVLEFMSHQDYSKHKWIKFEA